MIDPKDPFKNDALNRSENAGILKQFIKNLDEPYVIALDSPWGTGKTTFLKMWRADLALSGISSLYFNVWEADFNDDALVALIKEIELNLKELELPKKVHERAKKSLDLVKKAGYSLIKKAVPAAIKLGTYGIIDASDVTEKVLAGLTEEVGKDFFKSYETSKKSFQSFRKNLEKFAQEIVSHTDSPLVFIIDELDRCRPDFAVQVLEKIKHLFSVNNIVFVLGIDKRQIGSSISALYGPTIDIDGYLNRFIDLDYYLPKPDKKPFVMSVLGRHNLEAWFRSRQRYPRLKFEESSITDLFTLLAQHFDLTLREIEQIISQLVIIFRLTPENQHLHPGLLCFLLVLRKKDRATYDDVREFKITADELIKRMSMQNISRRHYCKTLRAYFEFSRYYASHEKASPEEKYQAIVADKDANPTLREDAESMVKLIQNLDFEHPADIVSYLVERIEVAQPFTKRITIVDNTTSK